LTASYEEDAIGALRFVGSEIGDGRVLLGGMKRESGRGPNGTRFGTEIDMVGIERRTSCENKILV